MPASPPAALSASLRIGELSRRVGVSPGTIRAWERRYGLPVPQRTESGYRLYTDEDEARIRAMIRLRDQGVATSEAAKLAREDPQLTGETGHGAARTGPAAPSQAGARVAGRGAPSDESAGASAPAPHRIPIDVGRVVLLAAALENLDEREANKILDEAIASLPLRNLIEGLILPVLRWIGDRWARRLTSPAQEHFGSSLIRGRLLGLARGWGDGDGPRAMLACPAGEWHDLGLVCFGLMLREQGWRIAFFGQDTPAANLAETATTLDPDAVVVSAVDPRRLRESAEELEAIASTWDLYVGGAGASRRLANRIGAIHLEGEPSYAAGLLGARADLAA